MNVLQDAAVEYVVSTIERMLKEPGGHKRAFVISTYVIGKEKILLAVRWPIWTHNWRYSMIQVQ